MKLIGLTGNIACGKTSVALTLMSLGVPVIDADVVAKEVSDPVYLSQFGTTDRAKIRELVFSDSKPDPKIKTELEKKLHPLIYQRSQELIKEKFDSGYPVVVYDASLLIEAGRHKDMTGILLVTCDEALQLKRLLERDKINEALAHLIIAAQMPQTEKKKHATWIIENNSTLNDLQAKVKSWLNSL